MKRKAKVTVTGCRRRCAPPMGGGKLLLSYQAALVRTDLVPGVVIAIQTFGSLVNFHPHLHALVSQGCLKALRSQGL